MLINNAVNRVFVPKVTTFAQIGYDSLCSSDCKNDLTLELSRWGQELL